MIAEDNNRLAPVKQAQGRQKRYLLLNLALTIALIALGFWYVTQRMNLSEFGQALLLARPLYILLSIATLMLTLLAKAWRWQHLFAQNAHRPGFSHSFWSILLGQYVNLLVPFLRLGEVARIYAMQRQAKVSMPLSLGTIVVEKTLDILMLLVTLAILLPLANLPDLISDPVLTLGIIGVILLVGLYLIAFQTRLILKIATWFTDRLPPIIARPMHKWLVLGLEGLDALRSPRLSLLVVGSSFLIGFLSILTPYFLLPAFNLPYSLVEAALIHIAVTIAITPPSTPAKIGIFDGAVAFMLFSFGLRNDAVLVSYTLIFHLVVVVPQILLGSIAASRTSWRWRESLPTHTSSPPPA